MKKSTNKNLLHKITCPHCSHSFINVQHGKGDDITLKLSEKAYDATPDKNIDGYLLDESLSNKKTRVYHNPSENKTVVSHRGTDPKDKNDLKNDALLTLGLLNSKTSKRVKNAENISKKANEKYKDSEITNVGYSLAGKVATLSQQKGQKVVSFNSGASPLEIITNTYNKVDCKLNKNSDKCKKIKNQIHNVTLGDPISISNLSNAGKVKVQKPTGLNPHSLDNFKKSKK